MANIGAPIREIQVEPLELPGPLTQPEPATEPERAPAQEPVEVPA